MKEKTFSVKLIILCLIAVLIGGIWAAHIAGFIDVKAVAAKVPLVQKLVANEDQGEGEETPETVPVSPIEEENKKLRAELKEIQEKLVVLENEKTQSLQQISEMQKELMELRAYKEEAEAAKLSAEELAKYYKEMKPDAIVEIMNNLDDDTVMKILPLLEKEQTGRILSGMDSQRAALITQLLLGTK